PKTKGHRDQGQLWRQDRLLEGANRATAKTGRDGTAKDPHRGSESASPSHLRREVGRQGHPAGKSQEVRARQEIVPLHAQDRVPSTRARQQRCRARVIFVPVLTPSTRE